MGNAFLTVSEFGDFLQCAVSDVSDFYNRCVGAADSEVFLATVHRQYPRDGAFGFRGCFVVVLFFRRRAQQRSPWTALPFSGVSSTENVTLTDQLQEAYRELTLERLRTFASGTSSCDADTLVPRRGLHCTSYGTPGGAVAAELTGWLTDIGAHGGRPFWLESHLGFVFHTAANSVKGWSTVGDQREVCQAVPLSCPQWLLIEMRALESDDDLHWQLFGAWLLVLDGMVRSESLQHCDIWIESGVLSGFAKHGKTTRRTALPSLAGLVRGTHGLVSASVACCPWGWLQGLATSRRTSRWMAWRFEARISPCHPTRFLCVSRSIFMEPPFWWTKDITDNISTYSARRVLPSIADVLGSAPPIGLRSARGLGRQRRPWHDPRLCFGHASWFSAVRPSSALVARGYILKCVLAAREAGMAQDAAWDDLPLLFPSLVGPRRLPLATPAIVEEPTVDGMPDVNAALKDLDWFRL